jgi:hypothetical protein
MATWDGGDWTNPTRVGPLTDKDGFRDGVLQTLACTSTGRGPPRWQSG